MKPPVLLFLLICLAIGTTACAFIGSRAPTLSPGEIDAAVAATLAALTSPSPAPTATPALPDAVAAGPTPTAPAASEQPGALVAYTDPAGRPFVWTAQAGSRPLSAAGQVNTMRISADGQWIALLRAQEFRDFSLSVVRADGSDERQLFGPQDFNALAADPYAVAVGAYQLEWVPGGHTLAFSTYPIYDGPGLMLHQDLWLAQAEGGAPVQALAPRQGGAFYFSADGGQVALVQPDSIHLMNADGSRRRENVLTFEKIMTYSEYQYYVRPLWSADGHSLAVSVPPEDPLAEPRQPTNVWSIDAASGSSTLKAGLPVAFLSMAELSPDLQWVAYLKPERVGEQEQLDLHIAALDGSQDILYQTNVKDFKSWAPDSRRFVYAGDDYTHLELGELGAGHAPLTDVASVTAVQWLDASTFVFNTFTGSGWEIRLGRPGEPSSLIASLPAGEQANPSFVVWSANPAP